VVTTLPSLHYPSGFPHAHTGIDTERPANWALPADQSAGRPVSALSGQLTQGGNQ